MLNLLLCKISLIKRLNRQAMYTSFFASMLTGRLLGRQLNETGLFTEVLVNRIKRYRLVFHSLLDFDLQVLLINIFIKISKN